MTDHWLETATNELERVLDIDYGVNVDRAVLANILDRRRANLAWLPQMDQQQAEDLLSNDELHEVARMIAAYHRLPHGVP